MTAALRIETVEAYPCGRPSDRERYGMTPLMAALYAHFVDMHGEAPEEPFAPQYRELLRHFERTGFGCIHGAVRGLVERGWIEPIRQYNGYAWQYRFVLPVMRFPIAPTQRKDR